ncbi:MAG: Blue-light-activated protein [Gemmatimonadetes bacterium]|nr:Blue-light-activated protein [Gemmatimonadota bacterium]
MRTALDRASLGVKLGVFSALVTAAVVLIALSSLSLQVRNTTRARFADELARSQRSLQQLEEGKSDQLQLAASIVGKAPSMRYILETWRSETATGTPRADLVSMLEEQLRDVLPRTGGDMLLVTDERGRVFVSQSRSGTGAGTSIARGTDLATVPAVQLALDPSAPSDSGHVAVLRNGPALLQVAVQPLVSGGVTVGALALGRTLDSSYVAAAQKRFDGEVLLTSGSDVVAGTIAALDSATRARLAARDTAAGAPTFTLPIGDEEYVAAPVSLGVTTQGAPVQLWMLAPLTRAVSALTAPLYRGFALYGTFAVLLAGLGAAFAARSVLRPFHQFVAFLRGGAGSTPGMPQRFDASTAAVEVRSLNQSFEVLMDSLRDRRRELEQRTSELAAANVVLTDEISERTRVEAALAESEQQLRQSQKLEAIGTLAGGIAHDFNNLITVISGYGQLALMHAEKGSATEDDLKQVIEASHRAATLTHQLLAFSRKQVLQPTVLDLAEVVDNVAPMLQRVLGEQVELRVHHGESLARVRADRGQLEQVLLNLVVNARDAMPDGGSLEVRVQNVGEAGSDWRSATGVQLVVRDSGSGIPADIRDRVFEPFFTTKEVGKGTGLGLSTVYGIVRQSGGTIEIESATGMGTSFIITLPPVDEQAVVAGVLDDPMDLPRGEECILVVEDEDSVRILARRTLVERGYRVLVARTAEEALEIARGASIDLLLSDIVLPKLSGPQLVERYLREHPAPALVLMSGYADDRLAQYELDASITFLRKPFTPAMLARVVRNSLDAVQGSPLVLHGE